MNSAYIILFLFIGIVFIGISYMIYSRTKSKKDPDFIPNNEFKKKDKKSNNVLLFFYADWCTYSQKSKKIWETIINDPNFQEFEISYVSINSDDKDNSPILSEYNINNYPSIVLKKDDKKIIFDANLSKETLMKFLTTIYAS